MPLTVSEAFDGLVKAIELDVDVEATSFTTIIWNHKAPHCQLALT